MNFSRSFVATLAAMALSSTSSSSGVCTAAAAGTWESKSMEVDGLSRSYLVYTPQNYDQDVGGVVIFFHGASGSSADHPYWNVDGWSDEFGFLALVPDGSPSSSGGPGGGGGGKKNASTRKMKRGAGGSSYIWNTDDTSGVNEVKFVQQMLATEYSTGIGPKIAFGFSNGAAMSSVMCCYDSADLFSAHVGCHVDDAAIFDESCSNAVGKKRRSLVADSTGIVNDSPQERLLQAFSTDFTYNAVGDSDFFLDTVGVPGLFLQHATRGATCSSVDYEDCIKVCTDATSATCPFDSCIGNDPMDTNTDPKFECYAYPGCEEAGRLCLYGDGFGHNVDTSMTAQMYSYLTENDQKSYDSSAGGGGGGDCKECGLNPCCKECKKVKGQLTCLD